MENLDQKVYSKEVIEFTAVANEYCAFLESLSQYEGLQVLKYMQKLLPLLYSKTLALPVFQSNIDEEQEKFIGEADWQDIHDKIIGRLGEANDYLEVFDEQIEFSESAVQGSIAENLADIYQDLKDYLIAYSLGTPELMNESVWACQESFNLYWGQKLVNCLRAIHYALKFPERVGNREKGVEDDNSEIDTSDWIISRRQAEAREDGSNEL